MKHALSAAALLLMAASPAFAQTTTVVVQNGVQVAPGDAATKGCPAMPAAPPALPVDGAAAKQADMMKGQEAFNAWIAAARPAVECRQNEVKAMNAELLAMQAKVKTRAEQYNPDVANYNGVVDKWRIVVEAYQAKTAKKK